MKKIIHAVLLASLLAASLWAREASFFAPPTVRAPWLLDWGGGLTAAAASGDPQSQEDLSAALGGNLWARLSLGGPWSLYGRLRNQALLGILPWPPASPEPEHLWTLDAAYLQLQDGEGGITFSLGRKLFLLGSGLILAGSGDGMELQLANPWFNAKLFGFYTGFLSPDFSDYAMHSRDEESGARRYFGGFSLGMDILGQELSFQGMYQSDYRMATEFLYTSWYSGLRLRGLVVGGEYLAEWYLQSGFSPSGDDRGNIRAFGGTNRYTRFFAAPWSPRLTLQYSLASGDGDRSSTDGGVGNSEGADTAFQAFGKLDLGTVFRPAFSNIQVAQISFGMNPHRSTLLDLKYLFYGKTVPRGVVNAGDAGLSAFDVGHALETGLQWAPFNDLSFFLSGGVFIPGAAFPKGQELRFALSGGMSLSF